MRFKTAPLQENATTSTPNPPPYDGKGIWKCDGSDCCLGSGERTYFWYRDCPNIFVETCYTLKSVSPGPTWKTNGSHYAGATHQQRYRWKRTYSMENGVRVEIDGNDELE